MIWLIAFPVIWLLAGYVAARIYIFDEAKEDLSAWFAFALLIFGLFALAFALFEADEENIAKGFGFRHNSKAVSMFMLKFFRIKE